MNNNSRNERDSSRSEDVMGHTDSQQRDTQNTFDQKDEVNRRSENTDQEIGSSKGGRSTYQRRDEADERGRQTRQADSEDLDDM